jgi:hypothetical protein
VLYTNNWQRTLVMSPWVNAVMMSTTLMSFLTFQGSDSAEPFDLELKAERLVAGRQVC